MLFRNSPFGSGLKRTEKQTTFTHFKFMFYQLNDIMMKWCMTVCSYEMLIQLEKLSKAKKLVRENYKVHQKYKSSRDRYDPDVTTDC